MFKDDDLDTWTAAILFVCGGFFLKILAICITYFAIKDKQLK
ncbi:MAG: hypothetical protein AABY22_22530 [Nanoarchaeota archaeon]